MALENVFGVLLRFFTGTQRGFLVLIELAAAVFAALFILKTRRRSRIEEPEVLEAEETTPPCG